MTPTARSLKVLRDDGWTAGVVERFNRFAKVRNDLLGCIDIVAVHPDRGILGVQACSDGGTRGSDVGTHVTKALAEPRLATWLQAGGKFEVWGWGKRGAAGARKLWTLRRQRVALNWHDELIVEAA